MPKRALITGITGYVGLGVAKQLINEGFEVKGYDTNSIKTDNGLILMFFVTVLQKDKEVYECQEYQTLDGSMNTLDLSFICRKIIQPYQIGVGT